MAGSKPSRLWFLLGGLVLVVTLGWLARGWLQGADGEVLLFAAEPCDLSSGPCLARHGSQWLRFSIEAQRLAPQQHLALRVELSEPTAEGVEVDFQGVEMFMGLNRFILSRQKDGSYLGEAQLPACSSATMEWQARVRVMRGGQRLGSNFNFVTEE